MIKKLKIRSAFKDDMSSVHNLIKELAKFERNPDQVIISVNDLLIQICDSMLKINGLGQFMHSLVKRLPQGAELFALLNNIIVITWLF